MDTPSERSLYSNLRPYPGIRRDSAAFSIIELCLAIAVIASMFMAVLGLLPAGMRVAESATATNAQSRVIAHLTSMMQTGGYKKVLAQNETPTPVFYYYDVEGNYVDSDSAPKVALETKRIYAARIISREQNIPNGTSKFDKVRTAAKMIIAMGRNDPPIVDKMKTLTSEVEIAELTAGSRIRLQAVLLSRMDSEMDP